MNVTGWVAGLISPVLLIPSIVAKMNGWGGIGDALADAGKNLIKSWLSSDSTSSTNSETVESIPCLKGAKNQTQYGHAYPVILGKHLYTPMYVGQPYTTVEGSDGENQYYHALYLLGYAPLQVSKIKLNDVLLATNSADTRSGNITIDGDRGTFFDSSGNAIAWLEVQQSDEVFLYSQKIVEDQLSIQMLNANDDALVVDRFSAKNPQKVQIELSMAGLLAYNTKGEKIDATVKIKTEISFDRGTTWSPFGSFSDCTSYDSSTGISTFTRQKAKEMRFVAERSINYSEIINLNERYVELRIQRTNAQATDGRTTDTVYLTGVRTWCFDYKTSVKTGNLIAQVPMPENKRKQTVRLGLKVKASSVLTGNINALNCILESCARTWNSTIKEWSTTETPTNNPSALVLKAYQLPCLNKKVYKDSKIDLDALGSLYEYCETNSLTCNGVLSSQKKLSDVIDTILDTCKSARILNGSKYSVFTDKPQTIPVTTLNNHNILKDGLSNSKSFDDLPDGLKIKFINENNEYQEDEIVCMYDDSKVEDTDTTLESIDCLWQTNPKQVWKWGKYNLAKRKLRPETWTRRVGVDGNIIEVGSLVTIQDDTILVGIGDGGLIKQIITSGNYITGVVIDGYITVSDMSQSYAVKIMQADGVNAPNVRTELVTITSAGKYNTFTFVSAISLDEIYLPTVGDVLSFGVYGKITIDALCFGKKSNEDTDGKTTFDLTLVPYVDGVYTADQGTIPDFDSKVTSPQKVYTQTTIPRNYTTVDDVASTVGGLISGQSDSIGTPDTPNQFSATAGQSGITLSCIITGTGLKNSIKSIEFSIKKPNVESWDDAIIVTDTEYVFDRTADGYPEASVLDNWQVKCRVKNNNGSYSEWSTAIYVNTDIYGTWILSTPTVTQSVSGRSCVLSIKSGESSRTQYGTIRYKVQIRRPDIDSDKNIYYKPDLVSDSRTSESHYKDGSGYVISSESFSQTLPLSGQNDTVPAPTLTNYMYKITAYNEAGDGGCITTSVTAYAITAYDVVKGWYTNASGKKIKIDGALGAESIYAESLAAISANMGDITAGCISSIKEAGETKPNVLLDLDNEEFRVGNKPSLEASGSNDAEFIHYLKGSGLFIKLKNFIVTAVASIVTGVFRIKAKTATDANSFLTVNPETNADSTTGTPAQTIQIKGAVKATGTVTAPSFSGSLNGNADTATRAQTCVYPLPVGSVYLQLKGQAAPSSLFGGTWTDVTGSYANRYFAAAGDRLAFGTDYSDGLPNITGGAGVVTDSLTGYVNGAFYISSGNLGDYTSHRNGTYAITMNAARSSGIYGAAGFVRPATSVIKIWQRTA